MVDDTDLVNRFSAHKLDVDNQDSVEDVRDKALEFARLIDGLCPDGQEKSLALDKLEEVTFWANAGISRNQY